jgi:hypothetical protein
MLKKIVIFSTLAMLLSACVTGPEGYLKRSANNKIIDTKGFKGAKRAPLYNKKYISQAKKNVITGEYEYDDFDDFGEDNFEVESPSKDNIEMYKAMIDHDLAQDRKNKKDSRNRNNNYPSLRRASQQISDDDGQSAELRKELSQIKAMLHETKREMANNKCPTIPPVVAPTENKKKQVAPAVAVTKPKEDAPSYQKKNEPSVNVSPMNVSPAALPVVDDNHTNPTIIEPIESL